MNFYTLISILLIPTFVGISVFAKTKKTTVTEIRYWYLTDQNTLAFNDADGSGKTTFWIAVDTKNTAVVSFAWPVRPNAKTRISKSILISENQIHELNADLEYSFETLKGVLHLKNKDFKLNLAQKDFSLLQTFKGSEQPNIKKLESLVASTPLSLEK